MAEVFGCCSSYVECSNDGKCLHPREEFYLGCQYRKNLEVGRIFYGKNAGTKVQLPDFSITIKGSNWWSYRASEEQKNKVFDILTQAGIMHVPSEEGYCGSRVLVDIEGDTYTYVLYAPGSRMLPKSAAYSIQEKLERLVHTRVEVLSVGTVPKAMPKTVVEVLPVKLTKTLKKHINEQQISMFDLMEVRR